MAPKIALTRHAVERWSQRSNGVSSLRTAARRAVVLPTRLAGRHWENRRPWQPPCSLRGLRRQRRHGLRYRMTPEAVLVVRGRTVVTALPVTLDDLATVLTWQLTGEWL